MSARAFLIAFCTLAAGCAGRALPQQALAVPRSHAQRPELRQAPGAPPTEAEPVALADYGAHGPPAFPEIRGSSGAVAAYPIAPEALEDPDATPADGAPPGPSPLIVHVPDGLTPLPPFDAPAPSVVPPPPFRPPPPSSVRRWAPSPLPPPRVTVALPGGEICVKKLALAGVDFQPLEEIRGIETPIQIKGPIGGIRYHSGFGPMVSDCRFALALATAAPQLAALGVTEMHFSGAYSYRTSRVGRLSLHAYGLALDVHEIVVEGRRLSVERDFARGIGCGVGPALNRVACKLRELGLFRELLTPDYNADHNNHFHLGVAPLGPLANELWAKRPVRHPSPQLPVFGNGSRSIRASSDVGASVAERAAPKPRREKQRSADEADVDSSGVAKATDDRRTAGKRRDVKPEAKAKHDQAKNDRGSSKRGKPRAEQERDEEPERKEQAAEREEKRAAKAKKAKRAKTPKRKKHERVKAAKRNNAFDKDSAT